MRFDDTFIDQVRNGISIVDLVGGYVRLQKKGKDYGALCPFHAEKTPSLMVSEAKQIFKCFGCGAGGDVFKFIMLMENLTFPESIHQLAESQGIPLPQSTKKSEAESARRQRLLKILEIATHFFCQRLEGKKARTRLSQGPPNYPRDDPSVLHRLCSCRTTPPAGTHKSGY